MYRLLRLFLKVRARSRRCSSFPNCNRLRWVAIWVRRFAADLSRYGEISILTVPSTKKGTTYIVSFFVDSAGQRPAPPFGISMLGAAKPLLRQDFHLR